MKKILFLNLVLLVSVASFAQTNIITITTSGTVFVVTPTPVVADFSQPITINFASPCAGFAVARPAGSNFISIPALQANGSATFNVIDRSQTSVSIDLSCTAGINPYTLVIRKIVPNQVVPAGDNAAMYFHNTIPAWFDSPYRYDRTEDAAYFFFDEKGMLLGPAPVNIDADDFIYVFVAVRSDEIDLYAAQIDGSYNPADLLIRPNTPLAGTSQGTGVSATFAPFTHIAVKLGPFSPDKATIKIMKEGNTLRLLDVKINPLYNGAIGVSFNSSGLEKPDYDIIPLAGGGNTIDKINGGTRVITTFNYIWYWNSTIELLIGKIKGSSHITRGRDILKEPTLVERINPTFGVSLGSDWNKNFFLGGNLEFARGGSISAGWHYGQVQTLVDNTFVLGQTAFTGTKNDIRLTNTMQWGYFVGITLDTRIFNRFLSRN